MLHRVYAPLRYAAHRSAILHVRGQEQARVVNPEGVGRVGEEAQLGARAHLALVSGEGSVVIVEPRSGPELPSVGWSDRGLGVHTHVAAVEVGVGRRSGRAR